MSETGDEGKHARAVVCDSCSRLISLADATCPYCGAVQVGSRFARVVRVWLRDRAVWELLLTINIVIYVIELVLSGKAALDASGGIFTMLGPSREVTAFLGDCNPYAVKHDGEYWRLISSAFLHLGIVHILFNGMALRSLGAILQNFYGSVRFIILYMGSAIAGGAAIVAANEGGAGASGAIFGLLGGGLAFGFRRGGTIGEMIRGQFGQWVLYNVIFTFMFAGQISVPGHIGGLVGGFVLGWILMPPARRSAAESAAPPWMTILAALLLLSGPLSVGASVAKAFMDRNSYGAMFLSGSFENTLSNQRIEPTSLGKYGAQNWVISLPADWNLAMSEKEHFMLQAPRGAMIQGVILKDKEENARAILDLVLKESDAKRTRVEARDGDDSQANAELLHLSEGNDKPMMRRLVHVHRLDPGVWLIVNLNASPALSQESAHALFARIVESIRRA